MKTHRLITIRLDRKTSAFDITPEGYLVCDAFVTRSGVFDYHDDDGKLTRELRPPEAVFADESLATLAMQPITFLHPKEKLVTTENIRGLQVGVTGENITHDGEVVKCRVKITDKAVIQYARDMHARGEGVELSCGYDADVEPIAGEHKTEGHYDAVQKNIRYNHVAIVAKGRAGEKVKLKLDQKEEIPMFTFIRKALKLDGFTMDAIEAEVPKEAQSVLSRLSAKLDEAVDVIKAQAAKLVDMGKKNEAAQAKIDTLEAEQTKLKADVEALSDPAGERVQAIIADRKSLEAVAGKLEIKTDGLDDKAVKVAVIQKQAPDFKADEKSDDYINARFDAVVELLEAAKKDGADQPLARFISDAKESSSAGQVDHRAEFIKKSDALFDGADE
ncbi:hypothetical protein DSCW_18250 [Desulfosarcina widdelii]|uniref:DUF2213 domain-containing protein n=1 Tax=Desulfosarcina widdelii TaxID=947919 RepID=A0A5K7Z0I5_9BACT|nr:DUF2213 domain-containing protein [Desulfosarcina widdelii]BBO74408.1 hypothetical protein DSCW_18250 [Desulfosarcina widdelii]